MTAEHFSFLDISQMLDIVKEEQGKVQEKLEAIKNAKESISIADMFDMQMRMNKLSQFSEMCSALIGASHNAISTLTRSIKGQ